MLRGSVLYMKNVVIQFNKSLFDHFLLQNLFYQLPIYVSNFMISKIIADKPIILSFYIYAINCVGIQLP